MDNKLPMETVAKIATLANLNLSQEEIDKFSAELKEVIDYSVEQLNKVETASIEPLLNVSGLTNAFREDEAQSGLTQDEVLQNTKSQHNGFFKVKAVLDQ